MSPIINKALNVVRGVPAKPAPRTSPAAKVAVRVEVPVTVPEEVANLQFAEKMKRELEQARGMVMETFVPPVRNAILDGEPVVMNVGTKKDPSSGNAVPFVELAKSEPVVQEAKYKIIGKGEIDGIVVHGANLQMQQAYRRFCRDGLGMKDYLPITVPGGIGKFMSPLSMKLASDLLESIEAIIRDGEVKRIVCIASRQELYIPIVKHLVSVPEGKDFAAHVLSLGKSMVTKRLGIDVEFYLAEVKEDGTVDFYKLG